MTYDTSLLLNIYEDPGKRKTTVIADGTVGQTHYRILEGTSINTEYPEPVNYMYTFDLGFNSEAHLIGFDKAHELNSMDGRAVMLQYNMETVSLEGDFDNYFKMFCEEGQQVRARYIFSPDNMEIFIDFLNKYTWEIIGNRMYVTGKLLYSTETGIIKDTNDFIKDIRPLVVNVPNVISAA
ncbi:MAG: hypothetical protein JWO47_589 [Candidatus Saccharibacteria bacterium]|nr:hypothetical protein [Candidatus Saccharibacteria bacterium]